MRPSRPTLLAILLSLSMTLAVLPASAAGTQTAPDDVLTVGKDDSADYRSIQAAVAAADSGDRIEVRPGTYHQQVVLNKSVTLAAPDRAILDGSRTVNATAVTVTAGAAPTINGFTMRHYRVGIATNGTTDDWRLENSTVINAAVGVYAANATGDWVIADSAVARTTFSGVFAQRTTGAWQIRDSRFVNVGGDGVDARRATGDWQLSNTVIDRAGADGIDASGSTGDWTVRDLRVSDSTTGLKAIKSRGNWTVTDLTVRRSHTGLVSGASTGTWTLGTATIRTRDVGVYAARTTGPWVIHNATINSGIRGIHADGTNGSWAVRDSTVTATAKEHAVGIDTHYAADGWSLTSVTVNSTGIEVAEDDH